MITRVDCTAERLGILMADIRALQAWRAFGEAVLDEAEKQGEDVTAARLRFRLRFDGQERLLSEQLAHAYVNGEVAVYEDGQLTGFEPAPPIKFGATVRYRRMFLSALDPDWNRL